MGISRYCCKRSSSIASRIASCAWGIYLEDHGQCKVSSIPLHDFASERDSLVDDK